MKNKKIFYILGGILIILIIFLLVQNNSKNNIKCNEDSNCDFFYTDYTENNPCEACSYSDENYECINKEKAYQQRSEFFESIGDVPLCTPCPNPDFESHICKCINNKCIKKLK